MSIATQLKKNAMAIELWATVFLDGVSYYAGWEHRPGSKSDPNEWNWRTGSYVLGMHERGAAPTADAAQAAIAAAIEEFQALRAKKGRAA